MNGVPRHDSSSFSTCAFMSAHVNGGANIAPGTPPITPREELAVYYELPANILELKVRAINAHVSQVEAILEAVGPELWWKQMSIEAFRPGQERS